ncbi:MAG TPA: prepilin-type N-terminal cleavage/methylation domain-containing protein, partial [Urbifossiella sp.]|nr:prepilin-type N-terminal cleavage/methylation domain-containing protein [Urbifossiella sp.]
MIRRPGLSLTEVLVALFIMGIGTIAILTLFPLGALNMAQALRDDRTTQSATQADAYLRWYVQNAKDLPSTSPLFISNELFSKALNDPGSTTVSKLLIPVTGQAVPSYPVVIDPMGQLPRGGVSAGLGTSAFWLGDGGFGNGAAGANTSAIPRQSLLSIVAPVAQGGQPPASQSPFALRICTLLDGFGYDKTSGGPDITTSGVVDRDNRYNWLWVIQRPDNSTSGATLTVVVFDRRAPNFAPAGSETVFTPTFAQTGLTRISFPSGQVGQAPPVQKGG